MFKLFASAHGHACLGYPLTPYSIRPFTDTDLTNVPAEASRRKRFNVILSSLRVAVEHAFGRLKGRFPCLRNMQGRTVHSMYRTVEALMILHNILEERGDDPRTIQGYNGEEDEDHLGEVRGEAGERFDQGMDGDELYAGGIVRRKAIMELILNRADDL
jgi:hypothetical protein